MIYWNVRSIPEFAGIENQEIKNILKRTMRRTFWINALLLVVMVFLYIQEVQPLFQLYLPSINPIYNVAIEFVVTFSLWILFYFPVLNWIYRTDIQKNEKQSVDVEPDA